MTDNAEYGARDLTAEEIDALAEGDPPDEDWFLAEGDLPQELLKPPYTCPDPTKWVQTAQNVRAVGSWNIVSSAVYAKAAPVQHTFQVQRSMTWGTVVTETLKGSLRLIELQLGISLDTHNTVSTTETFSYLVPKGQTMALFAAPGYVVRQFARTAYGSAMCNPVRQSCKVWSPYQHILKADRAG